MQNDQKILEDIENYVSILKKYNETTNIYSRSAYDRLAFHIKDSQIIANLIGNQQQRVVDMGSGSGLPSIVIAICNPTSTVIAVESKNRKRLFLHLAKKELRLTNFHVHEGDVQSYLAQSKEKKEKIDIYTAKAFAPLYKIEKILNTMRKTAYKLIVPYSVDQVKDHDKDHEIHTQIDENDMKYHYLIREHVAQRS
ncbi:MAG: class I SAM-dependent methyltransferase [bacterium]|nr:class I SAM-dependent methyltransferase [bacterium]